MPPAAGALAVRAARVVTGDGGDPVRRDAVVVVRGGVIEAVRDGAAAGSTAALDLGDVTLLPGFVDAHAHLSLPADGQSYERVHRLTDEDLLCYARANAELHLRSGVTTIRDNGARGQVGVRLRELLAPDPAAPRLLVAGRPLTPPGGHFHFCGGAAGTPAEIRDAVHRLADEGVDHIKIIASGGGTAGSRPEECTYAGEHLRAAVETARARGLATTAHCRAAESARRAVAAGVDCLEHLDFLRPVAGGDPVVEYDAETVRMIRDAGTYLSMTMQAGGYDTLLDLRTRPDPDERAVARLERYFADKLGVLRRLLDDGLAERIVISTDAGPSDTRFGRFHLGLELAAETGWPVPDVVRAATTRAAELCGLGATTGRIAPGYAADLIAVGGDLPADVCRARDVRFVMVRGETVRLTRPG
ncbi:amidohydrolase family protein [Dactylosporangium sp. CA-092794]|uniref:amidohydrolase family protein n=1 Tax=Dactylosporangium sp. CA-092794 TaxID=3239929 RepID=UPI003D89E077